jgi:hypothetical protein
MGRGTLHFEVTADGDLIDRANNVELLRQMWLDRSIIAATLAKAIPETLTTEHGISPATLWPQAVFAAPMMVACSGWKSPTARRAMITTPLSRRNATAESRRG